MNAIAAMLLSSVCAIPPGYVPYECYRRRPVPVVYYFYWSVPTHQYKNRPRVISPSHRKERLAWERRKLTEKGREDQLNARIRALKIRGWDTHFQGDRETAILWYKVQTRKDDPNWGGKWQ